MKIPLLKKIILISSVISAILSINSDANFGLLPLLPLCYGILYHLCVPDRMFIGPCFSIMNLVFIFRYILYPIAFNELGLNTCGNPQNGDIAIIIMLIEMAVIMFVIKKYGYIGEVSEFRPKQQNSRFTFFMVAIGLVLIALNPTVFINKHWIWDSSNIKDKVFEGVSGTVMVPIKWAVFFLLTYLFQYCFSKYRRGLGKKYLYMSVLVISYPCLEYSGNSRLSLLIPIATSLFMIMKTYGDKGRKLAVLFGVYAFIAMTALSLQKFFGVSSISEVEAFYPDRLLNAYFGGVDNVICGWQAFQNYGSDISVFFADSLRNVMGIAKMFEGIDGVLTFFNYQVYGSYIATDQIPPTFTSGLIYFNYIFCFLPTFVMTLVSCKCDKTVARTSDIRIAYIVCQFGVMVAWAIPGSWMHLSSSFFNNLLPIYVLIKISDMSLFKK